MNQNIFCSKCHRIPNQCCCSSVKEQDTDCQYCKQGCIRCDARKQLTDEEIDKIIKQHDWYSKTWVDMVRSIESAILKKAREQ